MTAQPPTVDIGDEWSRYVVDLVSDLVCVCRDGRIAFINPAGARMLGATPGQLAGTSLALYIHPDFAEVAEMGLEVLAEEAGTVPLILVRRDGTAVDVELAARLGPGGDGTPVLVIHARDVTERTRSAEVLLRNEERYRRLVEQSLDFMCVVADGVVTFINRTGTRLLGAGQSGDLVGRRLLDLVHPDYHPILENGLAGLVGEAAPLPLKVLRLDGAAVDVEVAVQPFGASGEQSFMVEARDISELKRTAEALREREQRLQGIMDSVAEGIITADERGVIQSVNPAAQRLFGWSEPDLKGQNLARLMPEPYSSAHHTFIASYMGGGGAKVMGRGRELEGQRRDGSIFPLELNVAELRRGRQRLFIGILRDITERKRAEEALRRARDELEVRVEERTRELHQLSRQTAQILNSASEGIIGADRQGRITFANPAAAVMLGASVDSLAGAGIAEVLVDARVTRPGGSRRRLPLRAMIRRGLALRDTEVTFWRQDGSSFPVEVTAAPIEEEGGVIGTVMVFRDITARKQAEEQLKLAATVFQTTAEAIMVLDSDYRITAVNPAFTEISGFTGDEVLGQRPSFLSYPQRDWESVEALDVEIWDSVGRTGRWQGEVWNRRRTGEEYAERVAITAVPGAEGRNGDYVVVASDITQRKLDEERIRYQANYDALTGLPNRALFLDRLTQAVATAARTRDMLGLMFIDLDGFKLVNDTLGHDIGDRLLQEAGRRLTECIRSGDTVARLGGDEFTVIMPNLQDFRNAPIVAQRILDSLSRPFDLEGHEAYVSASIGITTFPHDAGDANTLLKNADAAMYRAKEQGKANFQFFTADMNAEVTERLVIKNGLSKALEREEFQLYYQPKVDLMHGNITGVEALLRWRNPDLGSVSPAKFIPVMEETGLIGPVGEWALEVACLQHCAWRDAGFPHVRVAVNLSVRQLRAPGLAKTVDSILRRTGIDPSGIELEITESMIMKDTENAVAILHELNEMGIHLAMDDFGTGYSSLSYLKRFPLHTIKIDRSFVSDIAQDPDDLEIIRTIITMGHSLRRRIVAEGVETREQKAILARLRCDEIQGYLISPPVPAMEVSRMLADGRMMA